MEFDVFFSISQTPDAAGTFPDETTMYSNYLEQLQIADELGYGVAWLAQAHLSTEVQKQKSQPCHSSLARRSWIMHRLLPIGPAIDGENKPN